MQDPEAACFELARAVRDLKFKGVMVNGFSQIGDPSTIVYYDDPRYRQFWATIAELDVPFYLHPRDPLPERTTFYEGHPWLRGASWAFGVETATHALRLMASGIFDAHPNLTAILGHLGETLPVLYMALRSSRHETPARHSRAQDLHRVPCSRIST